LDLNAFDLAVLAAIAYHQTISRDGLKEIFGKEISRDLIGRLAERDLIGTGPREPRSGTPYTFVTPRPPRPPSAWRLCAICLIPSNSPMPDCPDLDTLVACGRRAGSVCMQERFSLR